MWREPIGQTHHSMERPTPQQRTRVALQMTADGTALGHQATQME